MSDSLVDSISFLGNTIYLTFDDGSGMTCDNMKRASFLIGSDCEFEWKPNDSNQHYHYKGRMSNDCVHFSGVGHDVVLIVKESDE